MFVETGNYFTGTDQIRDRRSLNVNEIKCPHCGQAFTVDEAGYAAILNQVRTSEFDRELSKQIKVLSEASKKENELQLNRVAAEKDEEIAALNLRLEQLNSALKQNEAEQEMAVKEAVSDKNTEIARLNEKIKSIQEANVIAVNAEAAKIKNQKDEEISELLIKINKLESEAAQNDSRTEIAVNKAVNEQRDKYEEKLSVSRDELEKKKNEIMQLNAEIEKGKLRGELAIREAVSEIEKERDTQKAEYEAKLRAQQESLEYYKDLKAKMSTKMIGETLEQHCENSFNMIRATAFRAAEFSKDNSIVDGTKGDYIYREKDSDGNEIISIMFEMKNEMDSTAAKHKNEDFFAKLDKDRKNKKCEYAVLVSMLESDSEVYNQGIVDVSYEYEKMYVIRPQFFIPMITILRNAALNSMEYKRQLTEIKNQEIDITNFEERIEEFKTAFSKSYDLAGRQFKTAIEEIDKTIDHLNKVKDNLQRSLNNFRLANNKAQTQLTIKALTKGNDTMTEMFEMLEAGQDTAELQSDDNSL